MSIVMLYFMHRNAARPGEFCGKIVGMEVAGDLGRMRVIEFLEVTHNCLERLERLLRLQVSDVLADKCIAARVKGNCVLQMGSHGKRCVRFRRKGKGKRSISPCPSQNELSSEHHSHNRIVDM